MIKKKYIFFALGVLFLTCASVFARFTLFDASGGGKDERVWIVESRIKFLTKEKKSSLVVPLLRRYGNTRIISEKITRPGLTVSRKVKKNNNVSSVTFIAGRPGIYTVLTEDVVSVSAGLPELTGNSKKKNDLENLNIYLKDENNIPGKAREIKSELGRIISSGDDSTSSIEKILRYVYKKYNPASVMISEKRPGITVKTQRSLMKVNKFLSLIRGTGLPARIVAGLVMESDRNTGIYYWAEVFILDEWIPFDPVRGYAFRLPEGYVMYRYGKGELYGYRNIKILETNHSIREGDYRIYRYSGRNERLIDIFNIKRLTIDTRKALLHLLLIPFGALFTAFCRLIIGIRSYGTFTPTLLAMTILYADWVSVFIVILVIGTVSILGRSVFPEKMNRVPRLSIILTIISLTIVLSVSLVEYLSININGDVFLLPIIIVTSLVDRFYTSIDDSGIKQALYMLVWTVLITGGCFFVMQIDILGEFILSFPETHFVTIAMMFLMEKYTGDKIIEYTPLKAYSGATYKLKPDGNQLELPFKK